MKNASFSESTKTTTSRPQINEIYIVRALAILGVILVHVSSIPLGELDSSSVTYAVANFFNIFTKFGTTTFIFLSAFVLFYSYYQRPMNGALLKQFYKRRFVYIIIPYLLFSVVYYIITIYYSYGETWTGFMQYASIRSFIKAVVYGKAFYHLYFVFISIQFYLLFPLLLWLFQRFVPLAKYLIWIGLLLYWTFDLMNYYYFQLADKSNLAITYIAFYLTGAYFGIFYEKVHHWLLITWNKVSAKHWVSWFILWILWIGISLYHVHVLYNARVHLTSTHPLLYDAIWLIHGLTAAIVLLQISGLIMRRFPAQIVNSFIHLGSVSFGIYIIHPVILFYYFRLINFTDPLLYKINVLGGFAATLFLSWTIVGIVFRYFKTSWILFGSRPKANPYIQRSTHRVRRQPQQSVGQ